jgi:lipoprotein signal peptidase
MLPWLGLALILLIADQFTKVLILGYYQLGDSTRSPEFSTLCVCTTAAQRSPFSPMRRDSAALVFSPALGGRDPA